MDRARIYVNQIARMEVNPVEQLLHSCLPDRALNMALADARLQTKPHLSSGGRLEHKPALGLAAWLAGSGGSFIVRMDLDRKLFFGKKKFEKQGEARRILGCFSQEFGAQFSAQFVQCLPGKWAIGHAALIAREPHFANRISGNFAGIDGYEAACTPNSFVELRMQAQWIKMRH